MRWCGPQFGWVVHPQLTLSENIHSGVCFIENSQFSQVDNGNQPSKGLIQNLAVIKPELVGFFFFFPFCFLGDHHLAPNGDLFL